MTDRIPARLRVFTGYGDDLSHLLWRKGARSPRAVRVVQQLFDCLAQGFAVAFRFHLGKPGLRLPEALPPDRNSPPIRSVASGRGCNRRSRDHLKNQPGSPNLTLLSAVSASDLSQNPLLGWRYVNFWCGASWHNVGCILSAICAVVKDASYSNHFRDQIQMSRNFKNDALERRGCPVSHTTSR